MQISKNYAAYLQTVSRVYEWSEWKCNARFKIDKVVNAVADQVSLTDLSMRRPSVLFESRIFLYRNRILKLQQFMLWSFNLPNLISHPFVFFWKRILFETFWQIMQTKNAQLQERWWQLKLLDTVSSNAPVVLVWTCVMASCSRYAALHSISCPAKRTERISIGGGYFNYQRWKVDFRPFEDWWMIFEVRFFP